MIVEEEVVHLHVEHHHVGCSQLVLSGLYHLDLLAEHVHLTERHVSLHSGPVLELTLLPLEESTGFATSFSSIFEALLESSAEVHHLYLKNKIIKKIEILRLKIID